MTRLSLAILIVFLTAILSSCGRRTPMEELTIPLILGIDLDEEDNLLFSVSSPVFSESAQENVETYQVKAKSIRESRHLFDALATGDVTAAKIQVLLIGKRLLEHENWFPILDTVYRNPSFSINTRVIMVDGSVSDVIFYKSKDKPLLVLHLNEVIDKNSRRMRTVNSTIHVLHRQMYERGITPSLAEIKKEKDIKFIGVSLLDKKGKYVDTLGIQNSSLLLILMGEQKQELTLSLPIKSLQDEGGIFHKNWLSINVSQVSTKIKTTYAQGRFQFKYKITMTASIVERLFPANKISEKELKKVMEKELTAQFKDIIKKIQKNKIDPIGLGLRARAYQYKHYKKVQENWGDALSKAKIDVSLDLEIKSSGAIK